MQIPGAGCWSGALTHPPPLLSLDLGALVVGTELLTMLLSGCRILEGALTRQGVTCTPETCLGRHHNPAFTATLFCYKGGSLGSRLGVSSTKTFGEWCKREGHPHD